LALSFFGLVLGPEWGEMVTPLLHATRSEFCCIGLSCVEFWCSCFRPVARVLHWAFLHSSFANIDWRPRAALHWWLSFRVFWCCNIIMPGAALMFSCAAVIARKLFCGLSCFFLV
jgi:hypothetical protein